MLNTYTELLKYTKESLDCQKSELKTAINLVNSFCEDNSVTELLSVLQKQDTSYKTYTHT